MATKKVEFVFPADAWDGIVLALTEYTYQAFVSNPEAVGDNTKPPMIPNPKSRDEAAVEEVMNMISQRFDQYAMRMRMQEVEQQNRLAVQQRIQEVKQATTITIN